MMEDRARQLYIRHLKQDQNTAALQVQDCGLIISVQTPWIGASPDGIVTSFNETQGVVEYKNPYTARNLTLDEACTNLKSSFCLEKKGPGYQLKRKHQYFYQVQCQMYCCDAAWCDFILRTDKALHIERISRDKEWWQQQIPKLRNFYFGALLPELSCPRHGKGGIREP